jgi:hypothetical protein
LRLKGRAISRDAPLSICKQDSPKPSGGQIETSQTFNTASPKNKEIGPLTPKKIQLINPACYWYSCRRCSSFEDRRSFISLASCSVPKIGPEVRNLLSCKTLTFSIISTSGHSLRSSSPIPFDDDSRRRALLPGRIDNNPSAGGAEATGVSSPCFFLKAALRGSQRRHNSRPRGRYGSS